MVKRLETLEQKLGLKFINLEYYQQAFTHSSYANEQTDNNLVHNERLEFLGDAVVELVISNYLYAHFPRFSEGELTKSRANIVCESSLANFAIELNLADFILLGKGEEQTGGRVRISMLADLFEAFVGALYLDQGLEQVEEFFKLAIFPRLAENEFSAVTDYKTELQEIVQKDNLGKLSYHLITQSGPAHEMLFTIEVRLDERSLGEGTGGSKKEAEQGAARAAIKRLN